ncbi:Fc.00g103020.m01.CDS01 [Cosmosporella sp. VM-42]
MATITILRHGQSLHNVDRSYKIPDPQLTDLGMQQAAVLRGKLALQPDLIVISPMTRTIQTSLIAFPNALSAEGKVPVQIWPDLREAHDSICCKGVDREVLSAQFPQFDLDECHEKWDYEAHSHGGAMIRAERVRQRLKELSSSYRNIYVVSHRGFIAYLVKGLRFDLCEHRQYRFAEELELYDGDSLGTNIDSGLEQDFGPTMFLPV